MNRFLRQLAALVAILIPLAPPAFAEDDSRWLDIELGRSVVIETPNDATAIAITDPEVAEVVVLAAANRIQIQGREVGSTDLVIQQGPGVPPEVYAVTVNRDLSDLIRRIDALVEDEAPEIYPLRDRIVVQGVVDDLDTLEHIAQVATIYDEDFINLMSVRGDHQVQLEVVFAEVSRTGTRELGINALWGTNELSAGVHAPGTIGQPSVSHPSVPGGRVTGAAMNAFHVMGAVSALDLAAILSVLDQHRLSKILAQPTLVCLSGQQCEFLSGGELPIIMPTERAVAVEFKEFGVKLMFVPTVLAGNVIDMRVFVEVSEPDPAMSVRLAGIEVPGFVSRKGQSHLRLRSGMTFAMAGLLDEKTQFSRAQVPVLGSLPIVGSLFRHVRHVREETELMIFVTPRLARPMEGQEVPPPPGTIENNHPSDFELFLLGLGHRPGVEREPEGLFGLER